MVQDGIEMLDSMLVAANRTLSESQKLAISNSMISCWSPVYVNILFHKSKTWRGNEDISLPSKVSKNLHYFRGYYSLCRTSYIVNGRSTVIGR